MFGLVTRLLSGAIAPLADQLSDFGARLLRKFALFFAAGICLTVVLMALTIAFDLWISQRAGAIVGALSVAGVYFVVALLAIYFAVRRGGQSAPASKAQSEADTKAAQADAVLEDQVDQFTAPLLAILQRLGLRREQIAVLAGASIAKRIGPLPLVGLAILAGFVIGRMATSWRSLIPLGLVDDILASDLFGFGRATEPEADARDEAA